MFEFWAYITGSCAYVCVWDLCMCALSNVIKLNNDYQANCQLQLYYTAVVCALFLSFFIFRCIIIELKAEYACLIDIEANAQQLAVVQSVGIQHTVYNVRLYMCVRRSKM